MATRIPLVITFLLSLHLSTLAQEKVQGKFDEKYQVYSFLPATVHFWRNIRELKPARFQRKWQKLDMENRNELAKKLGNAYYFNAEYEDAKVVYKYLVDSTDVQIGLEYYFRYALSLRSLGEYVESEKVFKVFDEQAKALGVKQYDCKPHQEFLQDLSKTSGHYEIKRADFNSPCEADSNFNCSDFTPTFYENGLVFSSNRNAGKWKRYRHTWNSQNFHDLYLIKDISSEEPQIPVNLGRNINTIFHESSSVITKDGTYMYFTRSNVKRDSTGINIKKEEFRKDAVGFIRLKLLRAKRVGDTWSEPEELPFNNDSYSVAHPALSPDGETLYFASDMPGTYGESDLFSVSIKKDGSFGKPQNLGPEINSVARETFPFISEDNILYFSSDWHQGLGGLDIFATNLKDQNAPSQVINLGEPINSKHDDFSFIIDERAGKGYFASNRPFKDRENIDDIYIFEETQPLVFD